MKQLIQCLVIFSIILQSQVQADQSTQINPATGAMTWSITSHGVFFSLTQLLPDQVYAFYVNRGFTLEQIREYANSCIYMTVIRNESASATIHFVSHQWTILVDSQTHGLKPIDYWIGKFKAQSINKPALVAFRWAQFPPEQEYEPGGDWNQGMLSVGLPPKTKFDVIAQWDIQGQTYSAKLQGVQCAE